jgi:mevalonate kinase
MRTFETRTCGKWILAGEHTVLRGGEALVFPLERGGMTFLWQDSGVDLRVEFSGPCGPEIEMIFFSVLEKALAQVGRTRSDVAGHLTILSELRMGAGLGASAALCVGLARWFSALGFLLDDRIFSFARQLEDLFHGESSGVDVAVAHEQRPLRFRRAEDGAPQYSTFDIAWKPIWSLSFSGQRGVTSECVRQVKDLWVRDRTKAEEADALMKRSVRESLDCLAQTTPNLSALARAIEHGSEAFSLWGLSEGPLGRHLREVRVRGALAAKPTGSGGGGYVLSLWPDVKTLEAAADSLDLVERYGQGHRGVEGLHLLRDRNS